MPPRNNNNDFDANAVLQKQNELDEILNNRSKFAEKIIDVLENDVKTQESITTIIDKHDKQKDRVFWRNCKGKVLFGIWSIFLILVTAIISRMFK